MDLQEYNYYEANEARVNLEDITSSAPNAEILQRFRDGDDQLRSIQLGTQSWNTFIVSEGDDFGWLGHFIGMSQHLNSLHIWSMPEGDQLIAFVKGIARNKSIRDIYIGSISDDARAAIVRAVSNYSQLESLRINCHDNFGPNSHSALGTLLESGVCSLRVLCLFGNGINDEIITSFANGFESIAASLEVLELPDISIGNEGLLAVVAGLANTTISLKTLHLNGNDFSLAAGGLSCLSDWLNSSPVVLLHLNLSCCQINDEGLQAFTQGAALHCRELDLEGNDSITATGLSCLSNSLQSENCRIEWLNLVDISSAIGSDGMEALACGLAHNTSMRSLLVGSSLNDAAIPTAQWLPFSAALCDPSSINRTYLSNHTVQRIVGEHDTDDFCPEDIDLYLRLNEQHPTYAPRCKILITHTHLDMRPFLHWGLKFLPIALTWFEQAKTCTTLNVQLSAAEADLEAVVERRVVEQSDEAFESRVLSAMYEFVRGMSMQVMGNRNVLELAVAYDKKIKMIEEENIVQLAQRDSKNLLLSAEIALLELENKRIEVESLMHSAQHDSKNVQLRAEIAQLEQHDLKNRAEIVRLRREKKKIMEENNRRLTQRDRKNDQLEGKIARLESEKETIKEDKWILLAQRARENMQLRAEITRLEHENKSLNFFKNCVLMLACFAAFAFVLLSLRLYD